jgi:hypothetical protein
MAIQFYTTALVKASKGYNPASPEQARAAIRMVLVGTIQLISALYPNESSFPRPLNQLLYDLDDCGPRFWRFLTASTMTRSIRSHRR